MPSFRYESVTSTGQHRRGVLEAASQAEVRRQLIMKGEVATAITSRAGRSGRGGRPSPGKAPGKATGRPAPKRPATRSSSGAANAGSMFGLSFGGRPSLSQAEMASFIREVATALEAGLPLMSALKTVRRQASSKALAAILDHLIERVEKGDALYAAARDYGPPFNQMIIGMLRAADASGEMAGVLHQLADLMDRAIELKREVMGATLYPIIVACLILASAVILVTVLVPRLIEPLAGQMQLPMPTLVVLEVASFLSAYWIWCIAGVALLVVAARLWLGVPSNAMAFDRFKLRVPVLGPLLRDVAVARFTRTLGTLSSAGLPILEGLRITKDTLGNRALTQAIEDVSEQVTGGRSLAEPLERSGLFPPLLVQVVSLGERSGRLEAMLLHAATAFDRKVNTSLKLFTKALPPALLVVMAGLGGFILAAILLPLLELQSAVNG